MQLRRAKQALSEEDTLKIIKEGTHGVLALNGEGGSTYSIPLSYVFNDNTFYFHGAPVGHKAESVKRTPLASFAVVGQSEVVPQLRANNFRSAIAFGKLRVVTDKEEKLKALRLVADKYSPNQPDNEKEIQESLNYVFVFALDVDSLTGKQSIDYVQKQAEENRKKKQQI